MRPKLSDRRNVGIMLCTAPVKGSSLYGSRAARCSSAALCAPASALLQLRKRFRAQGHAKMPSWDNGGVVLHGACCPQELLPGDAAEPRELVLCVLCSSGRSGEELLEPRGAREARI